MPLITRSDLQFDYLWHAQKPDNPRMIGFPDRDLIDRNEGYEVLDLINAFAAKYNLVQKASGQKAERMIRQHLPGSVRGRANVMSWLVANWKSY